MVNRYWGYLLGKGLVNPIDDLRETNPATNPELLDALADAFVAAGFDLKQLLRLILNSRVYQLSALDDARQPARHDVLHALHDQAADGRATARRDQRGDRDDREVRPSCPLGTRAIALPDTTYAVVLPRHVRPAPARDLPANANDRADPNLSQALNLMNGDAGQPQDRRARRPARRAG